jgi:hypothetical protein
MSYTCTLDIKYLRHDRQVLIGIYSIIENFLVPRDIILFSRASTHQEVFRVVLDICVVTQHIVVLSSQGVCGPLTQLGTASGLCYLSIIGTRYQVLS